MKFAQSIAGGVVLAFSILAPAQVANAQDSEVMEEVVVTGSRIRRDPLSESAAILDINSDTRGGSVFLDTNLSKISGSLLSV